ncbi:MAG TPA: hypothetical protein VF209_04435 [Patescibacteria group bacterium]
MTQEITGFKAVGSDDKYPDPHQYLEDGVQLPVSYEVRGVSHDYLTQIKEQQGLHSCLPTSVLNGLIHLGLINFQQANAFQSTFNTENADMFTTRQFGQDQLTVMAVSTSVLLDRLKQNQHGPTGLEFNSMVIGTQGLSVDELIMLIKQEVSKDKVVVADYDKHALLIIGYDDQLGAFKVIDPYFPHRQGTRNTESFANYILTGEPWITALSK